MKKMKRMNWNVSANWTVPFFLCHNHLVCLACHVFRPTNREAKIGEDDVEEAYSESEVVVVRAVEPSWGNIHASSVAGLVENHSIGNAAVVRHTAPIPVSLHYFSTPDYPSLHAATPYPHDDLSFRDVSPIRVHASHNDSVPYLHVLFAVKNHMGVGRDEDCEERATVGTPMLAGKDRTDRVAVVGKETVRCLLALVLMLVVMIYRSDWYPYPILLGERQMVHQLVAWQAHFSPQIIMKPSGSVITY